MKDYKIKYSVELGSFPEKSEKIENVGYCDKLIVCAISDFPDTGPIMMWAGKDGVDLKDSVNAEDELRCWLGLTYKLSMSNELDKEKKELMNTIFNRVKVFLKSRKT